MRKAAAKRQARRMQVETLIQAGTRRASAQASREQMKAKALAASLVSAREARQVWDEHVRHVIATCMALPKALAARLAAESNVLKCQSILDSAIRATLTELSQYEPVTNNDGGKN